MKNDSNNYGQLFSTALQIDVQRTMLSFLVKGHIYSEIVQMSIEPLDIYGLFSSSHDLNLSSKTNNTHWKYAWQVWYIQIIPTYMYSSSDSYTYYTWDWFQAAWGVSTSE